MDPVSPQSNHQSANDSQQKTKTSTQDIFLNGSSARYAEGDNANRSKSNDVKRKKSKNVSAAPSHNTHTTSANMKNYNLDEWLESSFRNSFINFNSDGCVPPNLSANSHGSKTVVPDQMHSRYLKALCEHPATNECLARNSDNESPNSDENSQKMTSTKGDNNKLFKTLLEQIHILHETNSKICRNLHENMVDIQALKHAPSWGLRHRRESLSGLSTHSQPMGYLGANSPAPTYHSGKTLAMNSGKFLIMTWISMISGQHWYQWTPVVEETVVTENMGLAAMAYDHWTYLSVFTRSDVAHIDDFLRNCTHMAIELCDTHISNSTETIQDWYQQASQQKLTYGHFHTNDITEMPMEKKRVADELQFGRNCRSAVSTIHSLASRIIEMGEKTENLMKSYRAKRSIDPLGALMKWAFGFLDSTDDKKYMDMFQEVKRNENATFELLHKQTTILSSTMQKLLKPIRNLEKEHEELKSTMNQVILEVYDNTKSVHRETAALAVRTAVNSFLEAVSLKLEEIAMIRSEEIQTMEAIIANKFHHNMVDMQFFRKSYKSLVKSKNNNYLDLPEPPYTLIKVDTMTVGDNIYIKLTLPLASEDIYDVKKLYPIPKPMEQGWSRVPVLNSNWIAIDNRKDRYITWKEDLMSCTAIQWKGDETLRICDTNGLIHKGTSSNCLGNTQVGNEKDKTCPNALIRTPKTWFVAMSGANKWLVLAKDPITLRVNCKKDREALSLTLNGTGILRITEPCDISTNEILLRYKTQKETEERLVATLKTNDQYPEQPKWDQEWIEEHATTKSQIKMFQPGIAKIKNVKKRSFDPIKANRGVILLQNIPHGFYEDEMQKYFGQFGLVTRVRLARSQRTGRSKGFAYIEFKVPEVAQIAADTMNNYIMFKHVLKTAYIPPEKQTHNFFRKDVVYTTDAMGQTSYSSAKTKSIEKEIENINRIPTDEEHAKRLKRNEKTLQKQQKKYGIDLSNIVVSGYSSSGDTSTTTKAEPAEAKKKAKVTKKVPETKPVRTPKGNKPVAKKDKKPVESDSSSNNGKSLLGELLNKTYDSETSDDDFKIDHSFSASADDDSDYLSGDESMSFVDVLASKLKSSYNKKSTDSSPMDTSSAESEEDGDESVGDEESEEEEPIVLPQQLNGRKKSNKSVPFNGKPVTSNGTVDPKAKAGLKRKLKENAESKLSDQATSSPQPQVETQAKKKKQNQNRKKEILSNSEISASEPEVTKGALKKNKHKQARVDVTLAKPTTSSEPESLKPPTRQKKMKLAPTVGSSPSLTSASTTSSAPETVNKNMKKKKTKQGLNEKTAASSPLTETTTSSEPKSPKQKNKKKKSKPTATVKVEKVKQSPKNNKKVATATVISSSVPENLNKKNKNKKNQSSKDEEMKLNSKTTSSSEPEIQNPKMKNKQKSVTGDEFISLKPEPANVETKKKKLKPVTSSLISENGMTKKSKVKANVAKQTDVASTMWSTVSETDVDDTTKTKPKGKAGLKTIVRKNVPKKKSAAAKLDDVTKVKQTPEELVQLVPSKVLKQKNQLKSKKKSK